MRKYSRGMLATGAAVLLLGLSVTVAMAQNARMMGRKQGPGAQLGMMFRPGAFLRGLNLTQQQKDQVKTVFANHKTEIQKVAKQTAEARMALRDDIFNGANQQTLQGALGKVSTAESDAAVLRSAIWMEIKPILTPDQLTQLQTRQQNMDRRVQNFLNRHGNNTGVQ